MKGWDKHMKVFISWSGNLSLKVALIFRDWLPSVIQSIEPYVSSEDIDKGARWSTDIAKELENSTFGVLCVTKENLEAPWLSFEAGALSKTMEKAFVTPFLFDIKRSEVQGPILQFQSTIFEKDDIKKMVKTLNKACGENGITEDRLDKTFDVWYPRLEESLNELKSKNTTNDEVKENEDVTPYNVILEEILELTRDNQKLIRNPESRLSDDIEEIKDAIRELSTQKIMFKDNKRKIQKYSYAFFEEVMLRAGKRSSYGFLMILSLFREDFPWIYDMGKEVLDIIKSKKDPKEKSLAIREFREIIEFTFGHPAMREIFGRNKESMMQMQEMSYFLFRCLEDVSDQFI